MASIPYPADASIAESSLPDPLSAGEIGEQSLLDVLSAIPDPRSRQGLRHPLRSLLAMLVVGLLTGKNSVKDCIIYGRERKALRRRLGFTHKTCPSQSTYTRLFQVLQVETFRQALGDWLRALAAKRTERSKRPLTVSVDGKALRGSGQHVLNVFVQDIWWLLDMKEVSEKKNEFSEFRDALGEMLEKYPFVMTFTFDAMFAQHAVVERLTENGRAGVFQIKENQAETLRRMERWFAALPAEEYQIQEIEPQGDYIVTRTIWTATAPKDIVELWPEARQIVAVHTQSEKQRPQAKERADEVRFYLVTGPKGKRRLAPEQLAKLIRGHWGIENRLHHVKDRTFKEDEQHLRAGNAAMLMNWLRSVVSCMLYNAKGARMKGAYMPEKRQILEARWQRAVKMITSCV